MELVEIIPFADLVEALTAQIGGLLGYTLAAYLAFMVVRVWLSRWLNIDGGGGMVTLTADEWAEVRKSRRARSSRPRRRRVSGKELQALKARRKGGKS